MLKHFLHRLPLIIILLAGFLPVTPSPAAPETEVVVEDPLLHPTYTTCKDTYWYEFANDRGHKAYLTLNASDLTNSTNSGEWHPVIPQTGYYRVEAYIPAHDPITWCNTYQWHIDHDTTDARYTIHHFYGATTRKVSQYPLSNQWLDLGEFYFKSGSDGYVSLTDLNGETKFSTTVSFSALRFTFTRATRPQNFLPFMHYSDPSGKPPPDTGVIQGQGFDVCTVPSIAQMQTWWNKSPYSFFGLYLGGIHFASFCTKADAAWVKTVHDQGWSFIPTWVGPQAPCSSYKYKINLDLALSYYQGRQEADAASQAASKMGLTNYGLGGTIIYYDMESYSGASLECRQAVASFMNGWGERLGELGNISGGYGARSSYITDWATVEHVPQDVWIASWYANGYDPYASVYGITWLDGLWVHHQRLRQYAGEVGNTWGGVSLTVDLNVADGMVAMPPTQPLSKLSIAKSASLEDAGWLSAEQGWLVMDQRLYWTDDRGANWIDITPADTLMAYFLPSGQAWAISNADAGRLDLHISSDWGNTWQAAKIELPLGDWQPIQLWLSSPADGWIVLQKQASLNFSTAVLLKTTDGGLTWQTLDLPAVGRIAFSSPAEAVLQDNRNGAIYTTNDGGLSWQAEKSVPSPLSQSSLPNDTLNSGWSSASLGWAISSNGSCQGDKLGSTFACQSSMELWQTLDGGSQWINLPLPAERSPKQ
jgi:photosystem II stability/assembly factor-like uncharacterized protein